MASSGKRRRSSAAPAGIVALVAGRLKKVVQPGERVLLGLSGGVDSMVLLDVLARLAQRLDFHLEALHVNHQLSPNAAAWARFCRDRAHTLGVRCRTAKVDVRRGDSVERAAREARYEVLLSARANHVVLAHNQDDQAETVLMQLLRGAGVNGLAAMPFVRLPVPSGGVRRSVVRPLLEVPRTDIERYAKRRGLEWIEDESNADTRYTRNWIRREVLPRIAERMSAYRETLTRAARNAAEAAALLDELACMDACVAVVGAEVRVDALRKLSAARAKNLLRFLIDAKGWRMPDSARLTEALRQALEAKPDARVLVNLGSCELRRHAGAIHLVALRTCVVDDSVITWSGQERLAFPAAGGILSMARRQGAGMSAARLERASVTIRLRQGGERLQLEAGRPRRTVKNLLQEAGIPPWQRDRLPFIYCGDDLACVPGIGVDCRFGAKRGEPSILPSWHEHAFTPEPPRKR